MHAAEGQAVEEGHGYHKGLHAGALHAAIGRRPNLRISTHILQPPPGLQQRTRGEENGALAAIAGHTNDECMYEEAV